IGFSMVFQRQKPIFKWLLTLIGFGQFLIMLFVVWWSWSGETLYQNRYVADDIWHRILVFTQMFGVATMGLSVSGAFSELATQFAVGYILVRVLTILMYARTYNLHPESRAYATRYMVGFAIGIAIWIVSIFLPTDVQWIAWLVAIVVEALWWANPISSDEVEEWGPDDHHMLERFGIFTIIVLGEAFVKVLDDAQGTVLGVDEIMFGVMALIVLHTLWWLYFSDTADRIYDIGSAIKLQAWSWGHFFLATSLVAFGVVAKKLFAEVISYSDKVITEEYRLLLMAGVAIYLVALAMINYGLDDKLTPHSQIKRVLIYLGMAAIIAGLGLFVTGVTATIFTAIVAVIMVVIVAFNIYQSVAFAEPQAEH
ncbi:MAG: low temperature requirement protein A, partial [Chloroflexota bacterium]